MVKINKIKYSLCIGLEWSTLIIKCTTIASNYLSIEEEKMN